MRITRRSITFFTTSLTLITAIAQAEIDEFQVAKLHFYEQISATPPTTPSAYIMDSYIDMFGNEATSATINGIDLDEVSPGEWTISTEFTSQGALDASFPGFVFNMHIEGGTLGTRNETVTLTSPAVYPDIPALTPASFTTIQNADPSQDLMLEWNLADPSTNAVFIEIYDVVADDYIVDGILPSGVTSFLVLSSQIQPDRDYQITLGFGNIEFDSGNPAPGFGSGADLIAGYGSITVISFNTFAACENVDRGGVVKVIDYTQDTDNTQPLNADLFSFAAFVNTLVDGATSAAVYADGLSFHSMNQYGPGLWDTDDTIPSYASKAELDMNFPSNTLYTVHIEGGTLGNRDQGIMLGADNYPSAPFLTGTSFSDLQGMDSTQELTINWAPAPVGTLLIGASIYDVTNGFELLSIELPPSTTSVTIDANELLSDTNYEAQLFFVNAPVAVGDTCPGFGTGSEIIAAFASATTINFVTQGETLPCLADLSGDGILDFFDVSAFLSAFATSNPIADFTGDGIYDFFDISLFLQAFSAGCP